MALVVQQTDAAGAKTEHHPEHEREYSEAPPLPHVADVGVAAKVGHRPVADEPIVGPEPLLDHQRRDVDPLGSRVCVEVKVLPDATLDVRTGESKERWRREIQRAGDLHFARGRRRRRDRVAHLRRRDPSAVDDHMAAVGEAHRSEHVITCSPFVRAVVDPDLARCVECPDRRDPAIAHRSIDVARALQRQRDLAARGGELPLQRCLLRGAIVLPLAETRRCGDHDDRGESGPESGTKAWHRVRLTARPGVRPQHCLPPLQ